jgi:GntR family transcriptional regulator
MAKYTDPRPVHQQIAADLRAEIMDGSLTGQLPITEKLTERFGVANSTITKALNALRDEGLIYGQRGIGVYVTDQAARVIDAAAYFPADDRLSYTLLSVEEVDAPPDVAAALGARRAVVRRRVTVLDGETLEVADSYLPVDLARELGLDAGRKIRGGVQAVLAAAGVPQRAFADVVSARQPTTREMALLRLPPGVPVLRALRTITSDSGRVVEVDVLCKGAHRFQERYRTAVE